MTTMYLMPSDIASAIALIRAATQPAVTPPPAPRLVMRYGYEVCAVCNLTTEYCPGHPPADQCANDGAETQLPKRPQDCQGGR